MNIKRTAERALCALMLLSVLFAPPFISRAQAQLIPGVPLTSDFTSARVLAASVNPECIEYCIIGICVQLVCAGPFCFIITTPYVTHRLPELVVTAHNKPGDLPWVEARLLYGLPAAAAAALLMGIPIPTGGGGIGHHTNPQNQDLGETEEKTEAHQNLMYRDTSAIGNPTVSVLRAAASVALCPGAVAPMYPYFLSEFDTFFWRSGLFSPEVLYPATWMPGLREVSSTPGILSALNSWGSVHPRHGFINSFEEPKGAAVLAQRSIDIVTRDLQPHVYTPAALEDSDEATDAWQMLAPVLDLTCEPFGTNENYGLLRSSQDGDYGWLYWPYYECCVPLEGKILQIIPTTPICLTDIFNYIPTLDENEK